MLKLSVELSNKYKELKDNFNKDPYNNKVIRNLADFLYINCFYKEAIEYYLKLDNTDCYSKLAFCYQELNEYEKAYSYYCKSNDHLNKGILLLQTNIDDAISFFKENNKSLHLFNIKNQYLVFDLYIKFIDDLIKSNINNSIIIINFLLKFKIPDYMLYHFANICYKYKEYKLAIICATRALEIIQLDITYILRANCYIKQNNYLKAIEDLNKAIKIEPSIELYYEIGILYLNINNHKKAHENFTKVLSIDNNYKQVNYYLSITSNLINIK